MQPCRLTFLVAGLLLGPQIAQAQLAEDESAEFVTETVLGGLDNPWGLAIRPGRDKTGPHELFVAESGAGRVIRVLTDQPENVHEAVTGLDVGPSTTLADVRTGPLGLAFLTRTKLLVTGAGTEDGQREVRVYVLPGDDSPLAAELFDHVAKLPRSRAEPSDLWSLATTASAAYVTSAAAGGNSAVLKANHEANHLESLRLFVTPKSSGDLTAPAAVTVTPSDRPQFLVVADMGSLDNAGDSRLMFYTLQSGSLALQLDAGLDDIAGLAYSPSGQLYAVDASWNEAGQGGVYRLEDARKEGRQACRAVKIASVPRGISLAFAPDGALYVTSLGPSERSKQGVLLKITGNF